jgi:ATP-dependent protease HslVU (ClpYQ) peptidase subunit
MSVVACKILEDRIEIASDSILVRNYTQSKTDPNSKQAKLFEVNGLVIGSVGFASEFALLQIFAINHHPSEPTEKCVLEFISEFSKWKNERIGSSSIDNDYLIIVKNKVFHVSGFWIAEVNNYEAIGAGQDFALAALYLGKNVEDAIDVACELSIYCEKPIKKIVINK